mmetsp:Transcript_50541/g.107655  ORF Transcript_50541/g.107655 Transcript_50541/m.107655 type:complete len:235 (+) Transcript_50541:112-816(+)
MMAAMPRRASASAVASSRAFLRTDRLIRNSKRPGRPLVQTRTKRSAATNSNGQKAAISRAIAASKNRQAASNSSGGGGAIEAGAGSSEELPAVFGMRPVDYSVLPPIRHSPPAPPPKPGPRRLLYPATLMFMAATVGYFYVNNQNDNYAYWEAMQSGVALSMDDDDDDDEYEDEEEGEIEETVGQLQQLTASPDDRGGGVDIDNTEPSQRRGWFGWLRGWRRGKGGDENGTPGR